MKTAMLSRSFRRLPTRPSAASNATLVDRLAPRVELPRRRHRWAALALLLASVTATTAQDGPARDGPPPGDEEDPFVERGLIVNTADVAPGYVLYAPLMGRETYLIDNDGEVVHTWPSHFGPGAVYLLDDGSILRCARLMEPPRFHGGGIYGLLERIDKDGRVTWTYELANQQRMVHHDVELLPNGNILFIAWEWIEARDALARGRHPAALGDAGLWPDVVFELKPAEPVGGEIVWEWRVWDHVVQDFQERAEEHGSVTDHPELIDVNGEHRNERPLTDEELAKLDELDAQMRALGYVGGAEETEEERDRRKRPDWLHTNAVDYHAEYDLIVLSTPRFDELWVIDHSTTTEEAAGHTGGRWGRGGDILWRWGNPRRYGAGEDDDQQLFAQHDPQWLDGSNAGVATTGSTVNAAATSDLRLIVYNNGGGRPGGDFSSVDELVLPFDPERGFTRAAGEAFGPKAPAWSYTDPDTFFSPFISGSQRLPNGNTLVCQGVSGRIFEVTRDGRVVWEYRNPHGGDVPPPKGVGGVPPLALFRATRYAPEHPGIRALLGS